MKTSIKLLPQEQLTPSQKAEMWAVYRGFYHYTEAYFMERLSRNTHFALYLHQDRIVGFTGLRVDKARIGGRRQLLFYFGQAVITREFRGQSLIPITALLLSLRYWPQLLVSDAWYWYDALSYKAYLVGAKAAGACYPAHNQPVPARVQQLRDYAGQRWYGDSYCPESGTVAKPVNFLNDAAVNIFPEDMRDPDVAFFAQANPNHAQGYGLLTFIPINIRHLFTLVGRYCKRLFASSSRHAPVFSRKPQPLMG